MDDLISPLAVDAGEFMLWEWSRIAPYYERLAETKLDRTNIEAWLADWSRLGELIVERYNRHSIATSVNTADEVAEREFNHFVEEIYPKVQVVEQRLKEKLVASGIEPTGFEIPMRNMRSEIEIFREANLPLLTEEQKLEKEYDKINGAQTVVWDGEERTISQMLPVFQEPDRDRRERAWRLSRERQLRDRAAVNDLWQRSLELRLGLAKNAGLMQPDETPDYRAYRWKQFLRFDYTPGECKQFHAAIEQVVVPAATRRYETHRKRLGVDVLRPWDMQGPQGAFSPSNPPDVTPLRPFARAVELEDKCARIFQQVDPVLGSYFQTMRDEQLLDLANRKNKAPGAYSTDLEAIHRPFIFMNAVGLHEDVQTLLHEAGHSFHTFEMAALPYLHQRTPTIEFCEVASTAMEFLGMAYLGNQSGFYNAKDAARAQVEKIETSIFFWPYMAVVDAFQHWVYENPRDALKPANCDAKWGALWDRFMPGVDWRGLDEEKVTGWHRKLHIFTSPFYYVEYGIAALGAAQIWANSLRDRAGAVAAYRRALALGGTVSLPQLFEAAGARFTLDAGTLKQAVDLMEETISELEG